MSLVVLAVLAIAGSCTPIRPEPKSPLAKPQMSADSVVLELFFIRFPFAQKEANETLWQDIDEQSLSSELRRRMAENGFRAGLLSGQVPATLSRLMELKDKPAPSSDKANETKVVELDQAPRVVRRHLQLRAGQRSEIVTSDIYDELPVLTREPSGVCGHTYNKAQGLLAAKAFPEDDGRVRIELVPELHYGDPRQRYVGDGGALRLEAGRPRKVMDTLALSASLMPGDMLILSSLPARSGSLGHHFFTCKSNGQLEQKLLLIRLAQTQHDGLFDPDGVLPLETAKE